MWSVRKDYSGLEATQLVVLLRSFSQWAMVFKLGVTVLLLVYVITMAFLYDRATRQQNSQNEDGGAGTAYRYAPCPHTGRAGHNLPEFVHRLLFGSTNGVVGVILSLWYSTLILFFLMNLIVWFSTANDAAGRQAK